MSSTAASAPPVITLEVGRDGWTGGLQLSINKRDESGAGTGYRIKGPKFNGSGETLLTAKLDARDAREIRDYLKKIPPEDTEFPATELGGHALIIEFGD